MDYSKSVIYTIQKDKFIYVGSTTNFRKRKSHHKSVCNNEKNKYYNLKVYQIIRENGGWDAFECKIHSKFPCKDKIELCIEEERLRKLIGNMNMVRAHITDEEYKVEKDEKDKKYRIEHKVELAEKGKEYYIEHKVEIDKKQKEYNLEHKVEIAKKQKEYRIEHKVEIAKKKAIKYTCECGSVCCFHNKALHEKTKKHIQFMKSSEEERIKIAEKLNEKLKEKHTCICGSVCCTDNGSISRHEKSKKHIQFMEKP